MYYVRHSQTTFVIITLHSFTPAEQCGYEQISKVASIFHAHGNIYIFKLDGTSKFCSGSEMKHHVKMDL